MATRQAGGVNLNLFIQGMRRSGTTILYDALLDDPELSCFYEPLREEKETVGGGSGARDLDVFAETRAIRERFRRERYPDLPIDAFNWGGPREPALELEPELPEHCVDLLRHLIELGDAAETADTVIKETRLYFKVAALHSLDPEERSSMSSAIPARSPRRSCSGATADVSASCAHRTTSSPTASTASCGRAARSPRGSRSARDTPRSAILRTPSASCSCGDSPSRRRGSTDFACSGAATCCFETRTFAPTRGVDRARLPDARPSRSRAGRSWARTNVRPPQEPYAAGDPRWREAVERLGMADAVEEAGYGEVLAS